MARLRRSKVSCAMTRWCSTFCSSETGAPDVDERATVVEKGGSEKNPVVHVAVSSMDVLGDRFFLRSSPFFRGSRIKIPGTGEYVDEVFLRFFLDLKDSRRLSRRLFSGVDCLALVDVKLESVVVLVLVLVFESLIGSLSSVRLLL